MSEAASWAWCHIDNNFQSIINLIHIYIVHLSVSGEFSRLPVRFSNWIGNNNNPPRSQTWKRNTGECISSFQVNDFHCKVSVMMYNLHAANVSCATVPMEVGPPCRITFRAALNTYAADKIKPPPEISLQLQQLLNIWLDFDTGASAPATGACGAVDIVYANANTRS